MARRGERLGTRLLLALLLSGAPGCRVTALVLGQRRPPNVVLVVADDLGWADLGCTGAKDVATPNLDRLAREGMLLTSFYPGGAAGTPSRAALLTGRHAKRLGLAKGDLAPDAGTGLAPEELTLAELLRAGGYATGCFGVWHLGHAPGLLPPDQGFDAFFGLPYSHAMDPRVAHGAFPQAPPLPLLRDRSVVEVAPDPALLVQRITDEALAFLDGVGERPFLLYVAYPMPRLPLAVSPPFAGRSRAGLYGDAVEELDAVVGRLLASLAARGLQEETLVVFTSDNGGWHPGSNGPLRGRRNTTWEGGLRAPCIVRLPYRVPAGSRCDELVSGVDLVPTVAGLTGVQLPLDRPRDGHDVRPLLLGERGARSPTPALPHYREDRLEAVRSGPWKLHLAKPEWEGTSQAPQLFDLAADPGETTDVAAREPEVVERLLELAESFRAELGDEATGRTGKAVPPAGRAPAPPAPTAASVPSSALGETGSTGG